MTQVATRGAARRKRHDRIRLHLAGTEARPRLAVFRSLNHIYAQVIDDASGTTLAAGGFYLFGGSGYAGSATPDQSFSTSLAATGGGVALRDANGVIVDSVGYGDAVNAFVEGHPASAPPAAAAPGNSAVRLPDGDDSNDNAADFSVSASPTPKAANH